MFGQLYRGRRRRKIFAVEKGGGVPLTPGRLGADLDREQSWLPMSALPSRSTGLSISPTWRRMMRRAKFDICGASSAIGPFILALLCFHESVAVADGGKLQLSQRQGNYQIAVFSDPTPLRVGPVDVSVLLLDADSGSLVDNAVVKVTATLLDRPAAVITQPANAGAATNKLFRAATFDLPIAGRWRFEASISGPRGHARTAFDTEVADQLPRALALWPWLAWPVIPILLYGLRELTGRRRLARHNKHYENVIPSRHETALADTHSHSSRRAH
jgi:hypothetical protein